LVGRTPPGALGVGHPGNALRAGHQPRHQEAPLRGVHKAGAQRRVPVLQQRVDVVHGQGEQLGRALPARLEDRPVHLQPVAGQQHFDDHRPRRVHAAPVTLDLHLSGMPGSLRRPARDRTFKHSCPMYGTAYSSMR
ncbi:unnamed protein product, partial [Ixodes pacificus]